MIAALGDTAKSKREPAAEPQTARSARQAGPGPGPVPCPHRQAAATGISGNAPRHAAQPALAQSEAHTPAAMRGSRCMTDSSDASAELVDLCIKQLSGDKCGVVSCGIERGLLR
jgi:hypothetical protein